MITFRPEEWAILAPNNDGGLGRMGADIARVLGIGKRLVPSTAVSARVPLDPGSDRILDVDGSTSHLMDLLEGLKGIIAFETFWHPHLLTTARELGVKTVCVPMWEWFRGLSGRWRNCDFFICPHELCLGIVRNYGYENSAFLPWTLDLSRFPARVVSGPGKHFVHNAGEVDPDDRKGTNAAIAAFHACDAQDVHLTVRTQRVAVDSLGDARISSWIGTLPDPADLYREGDVFIQPSKLEGLGFMVLEAVASGVPVITTDSAPMNQWVRRPEMLARSQGWCFPSYSSSWIEHAHLRPARHASLVGCIRWAAEHDLTEISQGNREWAENTFAAAKVRAAWAETLERVLQQPRLPVVESGEDPPLPCFRLGSRIRQYVRRSTGIQLPFLRCPLPPLQ